jgi:hypothetical protein
MIVLDTNVISALVSPFPPPAIVSWLDEQPPTSIATTAVTIFEIETGLARLPMGKRRQALSLRIKTFIWDLLNHRVLAFDLIAAEDSAQLQTARRQQGRSVELRDTFIAGIALTNRATLATRNVKDFRDAGLNLINPFEVA